MATESAAPWGIRLVADCSVFNASLEASRAVLALGTAFWLALLDEFPALLVHAVILLAPAPMMMIIANTYPDCRFLAA